jgi:methanogenic corrinoid protein MtbC1
LRDSAERLYDALVGNDPGAAIAVVEEARESAEERDRLFDGLFVPAMSRLGEAWASSEIDETTFAQAAVVAEQITSFVAPRVAVADTGITILVGSVQGDVHSIGRNMAVSVLKEAGHRVVDLGISVRPSQFLEKVEETGGRILVACAETMASAEVVGTLCELLVAAGHDDVVVLVAGGPFDADQSLARRLGANGVARGAESVLRLVDRVARERLGGA